MSKPEPNEKLIETADKELARLHQLLLSPDASDAIRDWTKERISAIHATLFIYATQIVPAELKGKE